MGLPQHEVKRYHASTKLLRGQYHFTISHFIGDKYNGLMHGKQMKQVLSRSDNYIADPTALWRKRLLYFSAVSKTTTICYWNDGYMLTTV